MTIRQSAFGYSKGPVGELRPSQVYIYALTFFTLNNANGGLLWVS
jgi:hypothetical protein